MITTVRQYWSLGVAVSLCTYAILTSLWLSVSVALGDYCDVADVVLDMRDYRCHDITEEARKVAEEIPSVVIQHEGKHWHSQVFLS